MGKVTGFLEKKRQNQPYRPINERLKDFKQVITAYPESELNDQASRCMDCGIPFCHEGCPLGNLIPEWNDLVYRDQWQSAIARLHSTNNFPEFTGTLCPAPCEGSCVLGINNQPVTIKGVELAIINRAFDEGWIKPEVPEVLTEKSVAIVGSGPAGLAAAQQLCRAGHNVTVFERNDRIGGLLRYGIPEFKMEKHLIDRRIIQMQDEGVKFKTNANVGVNINVTDLLENFDAILLTGGSTISRDLPVPGRELEGIYYAMDYLPLQNKLCEGDPVSKNEQINAKDKHVVIIGGGDTGADCLGTAHRQGAASVTSLEIMSKPPQKRGEKNPWPQWPQIYRVASAHAEGGERKYSTSTKRFVGDKNNKVKSIELVGVEQTSQGFKEKAGTSYQIPCDLAFLAMGFTGPEKEGVISALGIELTERGNVKRDEEWKTNIDKVFVAGDMQHVNPS
jgi:glutamate synthase (NADPH/NADH) small chain